MIFWLLKHYKYEGFIKWCVLADSLEITYFEVGVVFLLSSPLGKACPCCSGDVTIQNI